MESKKLQKNSTQISIKVQIPSQKFNNAKIPIQGNLSNQKRAFKIDLKLQYLLNELNSLKKFKQYLNDLNMSTKQIIKNAENNERIKQSRQKKQVKKNSFHLNDKMISKSSQNHIKTHKQVDLQRLEQIVEVISQKKTQISNHLKLIRKKTSESSIWDDKYFYDFTQSNYQQKIYQVQEKLKVTQKNLQQKQTLQKKLKISTQNPLPHLKTIKYSIYQQNTPEGLIADQNYLTKSKIMAQLKKINHLHTKISAELQLKQNLDLKMNNKLSNEKLNHKNQSHQKSPFNNRINSLKQEFQKIFVQFEQKSKQKKQDQEIQQIQQINPIKDTKDSYLINIIQEFNRQILFEQLSKSKIKITQLKRQTQDLQDAIKELQGYKALLLLRKKSLQNTETTNKKSHHQSKKINFNDSILKEILEHQFLNKFLALKYQTKFSCLLKKSTKSKSETNLNKKCDYFPNLNKVSKCHSQKKLICSNKSYCGNLIRQTEVIRLKDYKIPQITSKQSPKKIQTGSSAETNP